MVPCTPLVTERLAKNGPAVKNEARMEPKSHPFIFTARRSVTVGVTRGRYASGTAHLRVRQIL